MTFIPALKLDTVTVQHNDLSNSPRTSTPRTPDHKSRPSTPRVDGQEKTSIIERFQGLFITHKKTNFVEIPPIKRKPSTPRDNSPSNQHSRILQLAEIISPRKQSLSFFPEEIIHTFFTKEFDPLFKHAFNEKTIPDDFVEKFFKPLMKFKSIPSDLFNKLVEKEIKALTTQELNKIVYILHFWPTSNTETTTLFEICPESVKEIKPIIQFIDHEVSDQLQLRCRNDKYTRNKVNDLLYTITFTGTEMMDAPILRKHILTFLSKDMPEAHLFISRVSKYCDHCFTMEHEQKTNDTTLIYQKNMFAKSVQQGIAQKPLNITDSERDNLNKAINEAETKPIDKDIFSKIYKQVVNDVFKNHLNPMGTSCASFWKSNEFAKLCIENDLPIFTFNGDVLKSYRK